jgi:feruloyl esterase
MWLARLLLVLMLFSATSCAREVAEVTNERVAEPPRKASCAVDTFQALPDVRLVAASQERSLAPHCKVTGVIGTETNFELLLPDVWNGKFVMGGGGGFVGAVVNTALGFGVLQSGYATVGTDTGHSGHPLDASWALNNMERVVSFGHQAVHRTAVTAKVLIADYYDQTISSSLFYGCSRGGGQALMEAQRYPDDFDGIVASAPAYNWTGELGGRNTRLNAAMYPRPDQLDVPVIPPTKQQLLGEAIMAQCDAMDGLEDGILSNPLVCDFEVESLACAAGDDGEGCFTEAEVTAAGAVYDDFYVDGKLLYAGFPLGAELYPGGWSRWLTGGGNVLGEFQPGVPVQEGSAAPRVPSLHFGFGNGVMKYLVYNDPNWDYSRYSFDNFFTDTAAASQTLDATDPNLDQFRAKGGKLLLTNSWGDMAISALGTISYYESVLNRDPRATDDVRLVVFPGVEHCAGGPGPWYVNFVEVIDRWVDSGEAPDQLTAHWLNDAGQSAGTRPACRFPEYPVYLGSGDTRDAASFRCVSEENNIEPDQG